METKKKKSPVNYVVGIIIFALVVVGFVSIIGKISDKIKHAGDNSEEYSMYEQFISPVIMNDPDTFDDITKADTAQLLSISIWSILSDSVDADNYEYTDSGILIPKAEVEEEFHSLFGNEVNPTHMSVDGGDGIEFKYSEKKGAYVIPITGVTPIYTPKIIDSDEKSSSIILTVGYLASTGWVQDRDGNMVAPEPEKYMKIVLGKGENGSFYIRAIQSTGAPETVTTKK